MTMLIIKLEINQGFFVQQIFTFMYTLPGNQTVVRSCYRQSNFNWPV